jgi:hypothetical protein
MTKHIANYAITVAADTPNGESRQIWLQLEYEDIRFLTKSEFKRFAATKCNVRPQQILKIERFYK